jgi:hypothetical protein
LLFKPSYIVQKNNGAVPDKEAYQTDLDTLQINGESVLDKAVPILDLTDDPNMLVGSSMSSALISTSSGLNTAEQKAVSNGVGVADVNDCVDKIRVKNNLDISVLIVVVYKNKDSNMTLSNVVNEKNIATSNLKTEFFNAQTGKQLDSTICQGTVVTYKLPFKNTKNTNMKMYRTFKEDNIDIFNRDDPAYKDRCFSYVDKTNNRDTTVNYRINNYFQGTAAQCTAAQGSCNFTEIDSNDYFNCACTGVDPSSTVTGNLMPAQITEIGSVNMGVINCLGPAFVNRI